MAFSTSDKVLLLRLISDICPNSPELEVCSKFKEDDYIIMKPHDVITFNVIDEKSVGIAVISGNGGSGKTYGIGYYLYYKHFNRAFNKNNTVIYSILTKEYGDLNLEVKRSRIDLPEKVVHDVKGFFRYLTSLKGEYNIPLIVHLVIDNVNDADDLLKIVMTYRETVKMLNGRPVLKVYILTRIGKKRVVESLSGMGLEGPYPILSYISENASICESFEDRTAKYKVVVCKMKYDAYSYFSFILDLLDKAGNSQVYPDALLNLITKYLKRVAHIQPVLVVERIRNLVLNVNWLDEEEIKNELDRLYLDYPYAQVVYEGRVPNRVISLNLYLISKRLVNLFLRKYVKSSNSLVGSTAINQSRKIPLNFIILNNELYSIAYVQRTNEIIYALERTSQFVSDLTKKRYGSKRTDVNVILMYPWRLTWMSKKIMEASQQFSNLKIKGMPLSRKDILYLLKGLIIRP